MKTVLIVLLIIAIGYIIYSALHKQPIDSSQSELLAFKAKAAIKSDSLKNALQLITATRTKDSIRYVSERSVSSKAISYWKKKVSESKEHISDSLPDSTLVIEQAKTIILQDSVIKKQDERRVSDSLYIDNLESNFARRLANEKQQRELLEQETKLQSGVIESQKAEIRRHKREKRLAFVGAGVIAILGLIR